MTLALTSRALIIGILSAFAATSGSLALDKKFGDLKPGEKAFLWPEDLCFARMTPKGVVPSEGNTAVVRDGIVRTGPNPEGPYAVVLGVKDGVYVEPQTPDGSADSDDGFQAYLSFIRSTDPMKPDCLEPDGALPFMFGIVGNSVYSENMSIREYQDLGQQ